MNILDNILDKFDNYKKYRDHKKKYGQALNLRNALVFDTEENADIIRMTATVLCLRELYKTFYYGSHINKKNKLVLSLEGFFNSSFLEEHQEDWEANNIFGHKTLSIIYKGMEILAEENIKSTSSNDNMNKYKLQILGTMVDIIDKEVSKLYKVRAETSTSMPPRINTDHTEVADYAEMVFNLRTKQEQEEQDKKIVSERDLRDVANDIRSHLVNTWS